MNPKTNDKVKILFRTGLVEEGYIITWTDEKSSIRSLNGKSTLIIQKTIEDVLAIQVIHDDTPDKPQVAPNQVYVDKELKPEKYYKREDLRAMDLAKLRLEAGKQERENARKALTNFSPTGIPNGNYDPRRATLPRRLQPVPHYPQKKT